MLDRIRSSWWFRATNAAVLLGGLFALSSCATKKEAPLISGTGPESSLPWNQQEKWESQGQLGPMADKMNGR